MSEDVTMIGNTCNNCHWEKVEKLKASSQTCNDCVVKGTKTKPFLNWKKIEVE